MKPVANPQPSTPAPAAPANAQLASTEKPKPVDFLEVTYNVEMDVADQERLMKQFAGRVTHLKENREKLKDESKRAAIVLAIAEERVERGIKAKIYTSTFTVSDLYKQVTGEKPPGHVYTLKCSYVSFVLSGFLPETDWLANRGNCLELGQKVVDACIETAPEQGLQHEAVSRAVHELKTRSDKEAKNLREILLSVKPQAGPTEEQSKEMLAKIGTNLTPLLALEMFALICASGNLPPCLVTIPDEFAKMSEDAHREGYVALARTIEKVDAALSEEKMTAWSQLATNVPIQVLAGGKPAETDATETDPSVETEDGTVPENAEQIAA